MIAKDFQYSLTRIVAMQYRQLCQQAQAGPWIQDEIDILKEWGLAQLDTRPATHGFFEEFVNSCNLKSIYSSAVTPYQSRFPTERHYA